MESSELMARLEEGGWADDVVAALVNEQLASGAMSELADAVRAREAAGKAADATRLAVAVLQAEEESSEDPDAEDEEAQARLQDRKWARWRLLAWLRVQKLPKKTLKALNVDDRRAIQSPSLPVDAEALVALAGEPEQLRGAIAEASTHDVMKLAETMWVLGDVVEQLSAGKHYVALSVASRAGLELFEAARTPSDAARVAVDELRHRLGAGITIAMNVFEEGEPRDDTLDWLLRSKGGEPRIIHLGASVAELNDKDRDDIVARLRKKASKSGGFRRALLWMGERVLPGDDYIAMCKEYDHPLGIVEVLLGRDDIEAAAKIAGEAIAADHSAWPVARRFDKLGRGDLAIDMLRAVVEDTVSTDLEHWLADKLDELGEQDEALSIYRNRFVKRPAIPQFIALRERVKGKAWKKLRSELIAELTERRLHRPLMDIASEERDTDLMLAIVPELDHDQSEHAEAVLRSWEEGEEGPTPNVTAALEELEKRRQRRSVTAPAVVAAAPVPETVRHKKFGEGKVVGWKGEGDQRKLEIEFEGVGKKVLLARFVEVVS